MARASRARQREILRRRRHKSTEPDQVSHPSPPSIRSGATRDPLMRWDVINTLLGKSPAKRFLEIGVQKGICGSRIRANYKYGVDPFPRGGAQRKYSKFFRGPSDDFFSQLPSSERFDVVLVDGMHEARQVYRDVQNSLRHLSDGGWIVMHDCNPQTELAQRVPRQTGVWNGDCWKAMVWLRSTSDVVAFTIDSDHGIGVVRKASPDDSVQPLQDVPKDLGWDDLVKNRHQWLGLVNPSKWAERAGLAQPLGNVTVLSAIFGGRDKPQKIPTGMGGADRFILYTDYDDRLVPSGWEVRQLDGPTPADEQNPRMMARYVKTLALDLVDDADIVVWVDGRILMTGHDIRSLLRQSLDQSDIAGFGHPWRTCAYAEAQACGELGLAPRNDLESQIRSYRAHGYPGGSGLMNTMVLARRRTPQMIDLGRTWWQHIRRHTVRDQISLPYVIWEMGITPGLLGNDVYRQGSSAHFYRGQHAR